MHRVEGVSDTGIEMHRLEGIRGTGIEMHRLEGIRDTGIEIGRGSYAVVKKLDFGELECVGKEIHRELYESAPPDGRAAMRLRFEEECKLLSRLDHPNIVKFLGVSDSGTSSQLPSLVMEYLPEGNLSGYLEEHGVFPDETDSYRILRDVASGLRYLHEYSPPIIHRDLTANNVLLTTNMSAKISDLGMAKILDMSHDQLVQMTQTPCPGAAVYMPPEALVARPKYDSKIDIFSLGVLIVHVLSGEWPIPSTVFTQDPQNPSNIEPVTEFDRRRSTIEKIEKGHPLLGLIRQCLSNPDRRPDAAEVFQQVTEAGYYDILLVGKSGMGKSTLGNQLLQVEKVDQSMIQRFAMGAFGLAATGVSKVASVGCTVVHGAEQFVKDRLYPVDDKLTPDEQTPLQFVTANHLDSEEKKMDSVTQACKLLANNDSLVRVLDVPGFNGSKEVSKAAKVNLTANEVNLEIVRWIARVQAAMKLRVRRVVYFLPTRGPLEKADGILQEELDVMYHFFGRAIFNSMVVVATTFPRREFQQLGLNDEYIENTKKVFHYALKHVIKDDNFECPPIVYTGFKDADALNKIKKAPVLAQKNDIFSMEIVGGVCSRCSITFEPLGQDKNVVDTASYKKSKCHPRFVQRFTRKEKVAGGFGHIATIGTVYIASLIRGSTIWPGFTNSDEECPECKCSPGSAGCTNVGESVVVEVPDLPSETLVVNHTNKL